MENEIKRLQEEKASAQEVRILENAAKIRDKEKELGILLDEEKKNGKTAHPTMLREISTEDIASVVSSWSGIPPLISSPRRKVKSFLIWSRLCMKELGWAG